MILKLDENREAYAIDSYEYNSDKNKITLKIRDKFYTQSLILTKNLIIDNFRPKKFSELLLTDLENLEQNFNINVLNYEIILVGTGLLTQQLMPKCYYYFLSKKIGVEMMHTVSACRTFNLLMAEYRNVLAILFTE